MADETTLHQYGPIKLIQTSYYKDTVYEIKHWGCKHPLARWTLGKKFDDKSLDFTHRSPQGVRCYWCKQGLNLKALDYIVKVAKLIS